MQPIPAVWAEEKGRLSISAVTTKMGKGLWPAAIPKTSSNAKQPTQTARYQAKRLDAKSMDVVD